ncbi:MAG: ABC transporter ATP-binding protein [Spirochaetales bacterium]|nr:ABC transporter ATP-binding protein [Spirochaetales bacterium]
MEMLSVRNLVTQFSIKAGQVKAVDGISFTLNEGETLGLVGESGCGKTTTALSIAGLLPSEGRVVSGEILLSGIDLLTLSQEELRKRRWKDISVIFQGAMNALNPVMKVGDQITEVIMLHDNKNYQEARKQVRELFSLVEIDPDRIDGYPHEFSGGMKQRVMIAMALACRPKIVIGDEPTTALDVMVQAQILNLLERLCRDIKMGLLLITHDLSVLGEIADKVAVMYAGKIVEMGSTEDILTQYRHPYTEKLVHSFPDIYGKREMVSSIPGDPPNLIDPPSGCRFHPRCSLATIRCRTEEPGYIDLGGGHITACHEIRGYEK